jgi:hypothetical protein
VSTIEDALTLGSGRVVVYGVLSVGEHGDYPGNEKASISTRGSGSSRPSRGPPNAVDASYRSTATSTWDRSGRMRSGCTRGPKNCGSRSWRGPCCR